MPWSCTGFKRAGRTHGCDLVVHPLNRTLWRERNSLSNSVLWAAPAGVALSRAINNKPFHDVAMEFVQDLRRRNHIMNRNQGVRLDGDAPPATTPTIGRSTRLQWRRRRHSTPIQVWQPEMLLYLWPDHGWAEVRQGGNVTHRCL